MDHTSVIVSNCDFTSVSDWRLNNFAIADPFLASVPVAQRKTMLHDFDQRTLSRFCHVFGNILNDLILGQCRPLHDDSG